MSVTVNAFSRGGLSTYGRSWYDPRLGAVIVHAEDGESVPVTAILPSAINTVDYEVNGNIETTEPSISSATMTFTLSGFNPGSRIRYDVLLTSGETVTLHFVISGVGEATRFPAPVGDYGSFV